MVGEGSQLEEPRKQPVRDGEAGTNQGRRSERQPSRSLPCPGHTHHPSAFDYIHMMFMWLSCSLFSFSSQVD